MFLELYADDRQATHRLIRQPFPIGEIAKSVITSTDLEYKADLMSWQLLSNPLLSL